MTFKLGQKTKTQLRAGAVMTAFGMAAWAMASLPLELPQDAPAQVTTPTAAKQMHPR